MIVLAIAEVLKEDMDHDADEIDRVWKAGVSQRYS